MNEARDAERDDTEHDALRIDLDSLEPVRVPVTFARKSYLLCEATEAAAEKYRVALVRSTKRDAQGGIQVGEGFAETTALLVGLCLFTTDDHGMPFKPVGTEFVRAMPARSVKKLFETVMKISDMEAKAETEEDIEKEIKSLQERLEKVRQGGVSKNGTQATATT